MFEGTIPAQDNSNTVNNRLKLRMLRPVHKERVNVGGPSLSLGKPLAPELQKKVDRSRANVAARRDGQRRKRKRKRQEGWLPWQTSWRLCAP